MKHSLFFPLVIISVALTSCTMIRGNTTDCKLDTDCKETEMCYFKPEGTIGSCVANTEKNPIAEGVTPTPIIPDENLETPTPANPKNNTPTTPENNTPKTDEVSTEDLTKELDAFVDDITKGL